MVKAFFLPLLHIQGRTLLQLRENLFALLTALVSIPHAVFGFQGVNIDLIPDKFLFVDCLTHLLSPASSNSPSVFSLDWFV